MVGYVKGYWKTSIVIWYGLNLMKVGIEKNTYQAQILFDVYTTLL